MYSLAHLTSLDKFHQVGHQGCGRHGHGLWPSWFVAVMVCGRRRRTPDIMACFADVVRHLILASSAV